MPSEEREPRTVAEIGEFTLIDRLALRLPATRSDVVVGVGDDVAVFRAGGGRVILATCDCQVAGRHFLVDRVDPFRLGRKCAAINLSDIASVGGLPTHFLVSLILPGDLEVGFLDRLYDGLADEAQRFGADVVGGNVSGGDQLAIDLTLLGEAAATEVVRRDGARPGDQVWVVGDLGAAAAGLALVLEEIPGDDEPTRAARAAFETPTPRVTEARALVDAAGPSSMIDVSDGLAADLAHLCDASEVGVRIDGEAIPIADSARALGRRLGRDPLDWAVGGGEDYTLLYTVAADGAERLSTALTAAGSRATCIGEILAADAGRIWNDGDGTTRPLERAGWRHY